MKIDSRFLVLDHAKIHYRTWQNKADADWIILLHDALGSVAQWKSFPEQLHLETNLNILAYDRIGHGLSSENKNLRKLDYLNTEAVFLSRLLSTLFIEKPILFGHSDGGSIALFYASRPNASCSKICSFAAHAFVEEITLEGISQTANLFPSKLMPLLEKYHGNKTEKLFSDWSETWLTPEFRTWNIFKLIPLIKVPVLALQSKNDTYGSLQQLNHIRNAPNSIIRELKGGSHAIESENQQEIIKEFKLFIDL